MKHGDFIFMNTYIEIYAYYETIKYWREKHEFFSKTPKLLTIVFWPHLYQYKYIIYEVTSWGRKDARINVVVERWIKDPNSYKQINQYKFKGKSYQKLCKE